MNAIQIVSRSDGPLNAYIFTLSEKVKALPFYLTTVGTRRQNAVVRTDGFPDFHWLHTIRGEGTVQIRGQRRTLPTGYGFFLYPNVPHKYWPHGDWEVMWFTFNGAQLAGFLATWGLETGILRLEDEKRMSQLIREMIARATHGGALDGLFLSRLVYECLTELVRESSATPRSDPKAMRLQSILEYIETNHAAHVSLTTLAETFHVTPQHLCRLFRNALNTSPTHYLTTVRIREAKELLINDPDMPIGMVAKQVGFESPSYFSAVFRKLERITPGEFRRALTK